MLPCLTFCTHSLLALSFILPGSDLDDAYLSVAYNVLACCASILGLVGAIRVSLPSFAPLLVRLLVMVVVVSDGPAFARIVPFVIVLPPC